MKSNGLSHVSVIFQALSRITYVRKAERGIAEVVITLFPAAGGHCGQSRHK
jgi:hypothetical protein